MTMEYTTPELTELGSLTQLTLGQNGSQLDGGSNVNTGKVSPHVVVAY